jgi:hypothetical protein
MTLGNMRKLGVSYPMRFCLSTLIAATIALGIATPVRAAIMYFSCPGTFVTRYDKKDRPTDTEDWTVTVTFDADRHTVKITDYPNPLQVEVSDDELNLPFPGAITRDEPYGITSLTLSRINGRLEFIWISLGATQVFSGTCKPTNKLF